MTTTEADIVTVCANVTAELRDTWNRPVHLERIGQRKARGSGTDRGVPDALLYVNGQAIPCEFKRPAGGRFSLDQLVAAERRRKAGVETYAPTCFAEYKAVLDYHARNRTGVCPGCPTVPEIGGDR